MWNPDRIPVDQFAESIEIAIATMVVPVILAISRFRLTQFYIASVAFHDVGIDNFPLPGQFHEAPGGYRSHMLYPFFLPDDLSFLRIAARCPQIQKQQIPPQVRRHYRPILFLTYKNWTLNKQYEISRNNYKPCRLDYKWKLQGISHPLALRRLYAAVLPTNVDAGEKRILICYRNTTFRHSSRYHCQVHREIAPSIFVASYTMWVQVCVQIA